MADFDEFYRKVICAHSLDEIKNIGKTKGKIFEVFVKWYLANDPVWKSIVSQIWLWDEYPKRNAWGEDCGIDIVFHTHDDEVWAVQAKCYSPEYTISREDVNKFIAESDGTRFSKRLLIGTTDKIGRNAEPLLKRQNVICHLLANFRESALPFPESLEDLKSQKTISKKVPKDYQIDAIRLSCDGLQESNIGQINMACGTGKTLTSLWVKESMQSQNTLVLLPSLFLVGQTLREWITNANTEFQWLCVCSDNSVARDVLSDCPQDSTIYFGAPVTNDAIEIAKFLNCNGNKVIFSTYQSSGLIEEAQNNYGLQSIFDLVFADEAHKCAGKVSEVFSRVLDRDKIKCHRLLFLTATPQIVSSRVKKYAAEKDIDIVSMDDPSVFGDVLYRLSFGDALNFDPPLLADYRVVIPIVDSVEVRELIDNRLFTDLLGSLETDAETLATHVAINKTAQKFNLKKVISFHSRVERAQKFSSNHRKFIDILDGKDGTSGLASCDYISGKMPVNEREEKLRRLKIVSDGEFMMLSNARCLSEGVDVPSLDAVCFVDPKKSQIEIVQAVGRVMRKDEGKDIGVIIIPLFLPSDCDIDDYVSGSHFNIVWDVVNALRSHDTSLAQELDELRVQLGRRNFSFSAQNCLQKIIIDAPLRVGESFIDSIKLNIVENTTSSWDYGFNNLLLFKEVYQHCSPKATYETEDGFKLGRWVAKQRSRRKSMSILRVRKLERLGDWHWAKHDANWMEMYDDLLQFLKLNSNQYPSREVLASCGKSLGGWAIAQRVKEDEMVQWRKQLLEKLPNWFWSKALSQWEEGCSELSSYVENGGTFPIPTDYEMPNGFKLFNWAKNRRKDYRLGRLSDDKIEYLNSFIDHGWKWKR